jgi:hypothetical protein
MPIADAISKLITEHGSAEILRTHLALIRDQAAAIEKENANLKVRLATEEKKSSEQQAKIEKLTTELAAFKRADEKPKTKWGCFVFDGDDTLYCPVCYLERGKKMPTIRFDIRHRQCPLCKAKLA